MFKVILCGKICSELTIKEVGDRKVCNFTLACKNAFDKYESHVRCSIWGSFVDELVKKDYTDKTVLIDARIKTGLVKWKNQLVYGTMS